MVKIIKHKSCASIAKAQRKCSIFTIININSEGKMATDHTDDDNDDDDAEHREIESNQNIEAHTLGKPKIKASNNIKG